MRYWGLSASETIGNSRFGMSVAVAVAALSAVASVWLVPLGFQGRDDLHYLLAAERWLHEGVNVGIDHWASRLPYVLSLAAVFRVTGEGAIPWSILHSVCFIVIGSCVWLFGRRAFEISAASWFGLFVFISAPLLFRLPSTYYPEPLELAFSCASILLVMLRSRLRGSARVLMLLAAGLLGGLALSVRETSAGLSCALAALIFLSSEEPLKSRITDIFCVALGYVLPALSEMIFYYVMTGDPLHRFAVDENHVHIPSSRLRGGTYNGSGGILFNWDLASRWHIASPVEVHWSVNALVRLFTSPGMLLIPWAAIIGGTLACRQSKSAKRYAIFTLLTALLFYLINTFVIVVAPNVRYFGIGLVLMCPLAGYALARIPRRSIGIAVLTVFFIAPSVAVAMFQPRPRVTIDLLQKVATRTREPLHLSPRLAKMSALRLREAPAFAAAATSTPVPVGGLLVTGHDEWASSHFVCRDGHLAFQRLQVVRPRSWQWRLIERAHVSVMVPRKIAAVIQHEADSLRLWRRHC